MRKSNFNNLKKHTNKIFLILAICFAFSMTNTTTASENQASAEETTVTGWVIDMYTGTALEGVTVQVKNAEVTVSTDEEGSYSINVPEGSTTLIFSYSGYQTLQIDIDERTEIEVSMSVTDTQDQTDLWE